jgi:hypothetical protein
MKSSVLASVAALWFAATAAGQDASGNGLVPHVAADTGPPSKEQWLQREDAVDELADPKKRLSGYLELRRLWRNRTNGVEPAALDRLSRKIALAAERAGTDEPTPAERFSWGQAAAEIGTSYVAANDLGRALNWERVCHRIEPDGPWASTLRDRLHARMDDTLEARLNEEDWPEARDVLERWATLTPEDRAVDNGRRLYGQARSEALKAQVRDEGVVPAMEAAQKEATWAPDLQTDWDAVRAAAAQALQKPFEAAISEQNTKAAEEALRRQERLAERFTLEAAIADNRRRLAALYKKLEKIPLHRPYGMVRAGAVRVDLFGGTGNVEFTRGGQSCAETGVPVSGLVDLRLYGDEDSAWWWGFSVWGSQSAAAEDEREGSQLLAGGHALVGRRGKRWSYWAGLGAMQGEAEFLGPSLNTDVSGTILADIRVGGEWALTKKFGLQGDAWYGGDSEFTRYRVATVFRYYASPNFSLGLQAVAEATSFDVEDSNIEVESESTAVGPVMLLQF